jgi:hypothetical protein
MIPEIKDEDVEFNKKYKDTSKSTNSFSRNSKNYKGVRNKLIK